MATREKCEGLSSRVVSFTQSDRFLFHSFCLRALNIPDDNTNLKLRWHDIKRRSYNSLAQGKMNTRIVHENEPSRDFSDFFYMPKILVPKT